MCMCQSEPAGTCPPCVRVRWIGGYICRCLLLVRRGLHERHVGGAATGYRPQSRRCTQVVGSRGTAVGEGGSERHDSVSRTVPWTQPLVVLPVYVCVLTCDSFSWKFLGIAILLSSVFLKLLYFTNSCGYKLICKLVIFIFYLTLPHRALCLLVFLHVCFLELWGVAKAVYV